MPTPIRPARYTVSFGLSGCYMPNSEPFAVSFMRRRELAAFIRSELETYDLPAYLFSDVRIMGLWSSIQRNGSSCYHFSLKHGGYSLSFSGLTTQEYEEASQDD